MIAPIDGDILVYRCGFSAEHNEHFIYLKDGDGALLSSFLDKRKAKKWLKDNGLELSEVDIETVTTNEPIENALHSLKMQINLIKNSMLTNDVHIYLTGKDNFRIELYPEYKANRADATKPYHYEGLRYYLTNYWDTHVVDGIEADDALGILQCKANEGNPLTIDAQPASVLCSIDKDLKMIPGWHFNWTTGEYDFVSPEQGIRNFYQQVLTGDSTDNIPGIYKIGPVKAKKILADCNDEHEMYAECVKQWISAGHTIEDMHLSAKLLWIMRTEDDIWEPPNDN